MGCRMTQDEINEAEWNDPRNWHGGWLGLYRSRRDSRAWVPKRFPALGVTVNFARRSGVLGLLLILSAGFAVAAVALIAAR